MQHSPEKIEEIARAFAAILAEEIGAANLAEAVRRNSEDGADQSEHICHSHDFCDANMCMDEALREHGVVMFADGEMPDETVDLFNAAWTLAKRNAFWSRP